MGVSLADDMTSIEDENYVMSETTSATEESSEDSTVVNEIRCNESSYERENSKQVHYDEEQTVPSGGESKTVPSGGGKIKSTPSGGSQTPMTPEMLTINPFGFSAKTNFSAKENLLQCRSESYLIRREEPEVDIWDRKPPDFRPQSFAPKPPPRNAAESMKPWRYKNGMDNYYKWRLSQKKDGLILPQILRPKYEDPLGEFESRYIPPGPHESRVEAVRMGFKKGIYVNPKPHDHRGLPPISKLGLDEFITSYERDPFNIKFESQRLHTILGPPPVIVPRDILPGRFVEPVDRFEKWEKRLGLEKDRYPDRPGSYTRFRRERPARSAFLNRVEERLTTDWAKEQMCKALTNQERRQVEQRVTS